MDSPDRRTPAQRRALLRVIPGGPAKPVSRARRLAFLLMEEVEVVDTAAATMAAGRRLNEVERTRLRVARLRLRDITEAMDHA